jgi:hypothetical protein
MAIVGIIKAAKRRMNRTVWKTGPGPPSAS